MQIETKDLYDLESILEVYVNLEEKKGVEKLLDNIKEKIFANSLNESNIEDFKGVVRKVTTAYGLMKDKFSKKYRDDGERYFEHLRAVANIVLEMKNPSVDKVLIALYHDAIEDVDATYEVIAYNTGNPKVALAVEAISKNPWEEYSNNEQEGKNKRNKEYFGHLKSFESMKKYVIKLMQEKNLELNDFEINELVVDILDVKFADRIHNLSTQWDEDNTEKVKRKIEETKEYFLDVAYETNPDAYKRLKVLILELEMKLANAAKKIEKILAN